MKFLRVKVQIEGSDPKIWRELLVEKTILLQDFHKVLQASFGWENSSPHEFRLADDIFVPYSENMYKDEIPYTDKTLAEMFLNTREQLYYDYNFDDDWILTVDLLYEENVDVRHVAFCVDGARKGPVEGSGGIESYQNLVTLLDSDNEDFRAEAVEWLGEELDPTEFSIDKINTRLSGENFGCLEYIEPAIDEE